MMAEAVLNDSGRILPCSTWAERPLRARARSTSACRSSSAPAASARSSTWTSSADELAALKTSADGVAKGIAEVKSLGRPDAPRRDPRRDRVRGHGAPAAPPRPPGGRGRRGHEPHGRAARRRRPSPPPGLHRSRASRARPPEALETLARDRATSSSRPSPTGCPPRETPALLDAHPRLKVVDLSGDFRLRDAGALPDVVRLRASRTRAARRARRTGCPECGQPGGACAAARLVANPGCHATATILALWPLARPGLLGGRAARHERHGLLGLGRAAQARHAPPGALRQLQGVPAPAPPAPPRDRAGARAATRASTSSPAPRRSRGASTSRRFVARRRTASARRCETRSARPTTTSPSCACSPSRPSCAPSSARTSPTCTS